jgi:competence ComEA-like helix-hairpin-helix protein
MFNKLSKKLGFTETEINVILFLSSVFIIGFIYKIFIKAEDSTEYKIFDYSKEDSLFFYYSNLNPETDPEDSLLISNLQIKKNVLELSENQYSSKKKNISLAEKSINLNSAGMEELIMLPGIGEKTAEKIMLLRQERGKFVKLEELMDVKGIGEAKFNKIKNY